MKGASCAASVTKIDVGNIILLKLIIQDML